MVEMLEKVLRQKSPLLLFDCHSLFRLFCVIIDYVHRLLAAACFKLLEYFCPPSAVLLSIFEHELVI